MIDDRVTVRSYALDGYPPGVHVGLPSPHVVLVVPAGQPLNLQMPGAPVVPMTSCVSGMHTAPALIHHDGAQCGVQAWLPPLALGDLVGVPAGELAGQAVTLADLMGDRAAAGLVDRVTHAAPDQRAAVLREALLQRRADRTDRNIRPELVGAWTMLATSGGRRTVSGVADAVGWSRRHLESQFSAVLGLSPKAVARVMRFTRATALVKRGLPLATVAGRCGYADQAHLTREWTRLAGTPPRRWLTEDVLANVQDGHRDAAPS